MNFIEAIKSGHSKTFQYSGRSSRSEYWWFGLYALISVVGGIFLLIPFIDTVLGAFFAVAYGCYVLWIFLISLSLMTRRFHDIGYSGIWSFYYFLITGICQAVAGIEPDNLVSVIASFVPLLFFIPWCKAGQSGSNRYGSNPLSSDEGSSLGIDSKNTEGIKSHSQPIISENLNSKQYSAAQAEDTPRKKMGITKTVSDLDIDQEFFAQAYKEIETDKRKDGLWAMVYATTESEEEAKKKYINLRAEELYQEDLARVAKEAEKGKAADEAMLLKEKKEDEARLLKDLTLLERLPILESWALRNDYDVVGALFAEGGTGVWKIKKLPFGVYVEIKGDLTFAKHLDDLYKKS